jgi:hypothetical protein
MDDRRFPDEIRQSYEEAGVPLMEAEFNLQ